MTSADRVALVTGAARGQGAAIVMRLRDDGFRVAACDLLVDELKASVDALDDPAVMAVPLDVTSAEQWDAAVATAVQRFGSLTTLVNNAGVLHRASTDRRNARGFRRELACQLSRPVSRDPGCDRPTPRGRRSGHRQHMQYGCHPAIPEPCRVRLIQMGTERPHPGGRGRTRTVGHQGQRRVPGARRDTHARPCDAGAAGGKALCSADSASRWRSPTRWLSWYPKTRRSSPVRNSSSTAANPCRSDDVDGQDSFGGNHRRGPGRAGAGNLPAEGGLWRLHHFRP